MDNITESADVKTPIGKVRIELLDGILKKIQILKGPLVEEAQFEGDFEKLSPAMQQSIDWMLTYFNDLANLSSKEIPIPSLDGENFTAVVYKTLMNKIGPGKTISYGNLASLSGHDQAARAVGTAMRRNDLPIVIPCHRVVKKDGELGNYSSYNGCITKNWLINHERKHCPS